MLAWVVDPWSIRYEIVQGHIPSQHPRQGATIYQYRKAEKVLHHRVFRDKGHKIWVGKMVVLQLEHME